MNYSLGLQLHRSKIAENGLPRSFPASQTQSDKAYRDRYDEGR